MAARSLVKVALSVTTLDGEGPVRARPSKASRIAVLPDSFFPIKIVKSDDNVHSPLSTIDLYLNILNDFNFIEASLLRG